MAAAFVEALKRPDVVKGQFDLLYASLLGEADEGEQEQQPYSDNDDDEDEEPEPEPVRGACTID